MITKINKVKDFGVLKNFNGSSLPEFKTFNLIYGWNYSGKTTLSRVFRCLEKGKLHDDYLLATFELENTTTKYDNTFAIKPNIRVFNSDFVKENLKWDSNNFEPIFLLGEENIELQKELSQKEKDLATDETKLAEAKRLRLEKLNTQNTALTNKAREITNLLSLGRTFDRDKLKHLVESVKSNVATYTLSEKDFDKYKTQAISNEQKPPIGEITFSIPDLETLKTEVQTILDRQAASTNKIQKLLESQPISDWVETGKNLHEGKSYCEFCGNTLPADLLTKLNEHFSKDYDLLKTDIETKLRTLTASKINLISPLPTETAFYTDLLPNFRAMKPLLEKEINNFNNSIASLIKDLESKKNKPFDKLDVTEFTDNKTSLETALTNFNAVVKSNDQRTSDFTTEKNAAIEKLKEHFAAEFETIESYSAIQSQLTNEQLAIDTKNANIEEQKQAINLIKSKLDETVKGAGVVNDYLKIFFGKDDIQITPTTDKKFQLLRETDVAKNLSEGEKTAIAFAYFTAKLEEQNNKITDTIVYIDDPVSSLDSNHLFNIYSFIKNKYSEIKQLTISTHNFEFFNLVKDWFNDAVKAKDREYFLVQRENNGKSKESGLYPIHKLLLDFKSEYHYLFSIINDFHKSPTTDFYHLYNLPNILRRFLEAFLGFKIPKHQGLYKKLDCLISDQIVRERVWKFINQYSHNTSLPRSLNFPDLKECTDIVEIVINAVKNMDKQHYDVLIELAIAS
jgi:wobble nucleotide-excising tRNase